MTEYFAELLNVAIPYIACIPVFLYPMWKARDVKGRFVVIFLCLFAVFVSTMLFIAKQDRNIDVQSLRFIMLSVTLPANIMPFFVFRKRLWHNLFLQAVGLMYSPIPIGMGTFIAEKLDFDATSRFFAASIISLIIAVITLPPLLFILKRLCMNPDTKMASFWKYIWFLPLAFFALVILAGSTFLAADSHDIGFIYIRILIYTALLVTCYLLDSSLRQVSENIRLADAAKAADIRAETAEESIRRQKQLAAEIPPESLIVCGELTLNTANRQAFLVDADLKLNNKEFDLLVYFISRENEIVTADEAYLAVWKSPYVSTDHALRGCLERLRKAIADSEYEINYLRNANSDGNTNSVGGKKGYKFARKQ
ncbi:MAG: winged helix-turn-helix domain-containing protein [Oscillospiraceae bacterium]|nr:winged helix-turn-helix domain-containing protein [Oscillospiraceae bacterium]